MTTGRAGRPAYLRPSLIAWVVAGGAVGSTLRSGISAALPTAPGHWPTATFLVNITGAFLLGFLLEWLSRLAPSSRWRAPLQLGVGTGVLGGYTTYSSFAVETLALGAGGTFWLAASYALTSVVAGFAAAGTATLIVRRFARPAGGTSR